MSNDELLFKYADLYEKGLLTRDEFDMKKKELLFNDSVSESDIPANVNDNTFENDIASNINENNFDSPIITIACSNLTKLLKKNVGDVIIIQYYGERVSLEIVKTDNPGHIYEESATNLKFTVIKENFNVLRNLNKDGLITITCKGRSQEVVLKKG